VKHFLLDIMALAMGLPVGWALMLILSGGLS